MIHTFSFSLTGDATRYVRGIDANHKAISELMPGSKVILHVDKTVVADVPKDWSIVEHPLNKTTECHFWRFESEGEFIHSRDIDSVISGREVDAFMRKEGTAYCMRDHYWHTAGGGAPFPLQGGMFGFPSTLFPYDFRRLVQWWTDHKKPFQRYSDMWFLNRYVYPYIRSYGVEFDGCGSHWGGIPFPTPRIGNRYVGEVAFT